MPEREPASAAALSIAPRWAKPIIVYFGVALIVTALHRYVSGLEAHIALLEPLAAEFATEQFEIIAAHPTAEWLHRIGGSLLVLTGLLQFSAKLRARRPTVHRWCGRSYVALAIIAGLSGAYMGVRFPFGGLTEALPSATFGLALVIVTLIALAAARDRKFERHREWMVRSFAIVLGPMLIRIAYPILLFGFGIPARPAVGISFWIGWIVSVAVAELWIARRRRLRTPGPT